MKRYPSDFRILSLLITISCGLILQTPSLAQENPPPPGDDSIRLVLYNKKGQKQGHIDPSKVNTKNAGLIQKLEARPVKNNSVNGLSTHLMKFMRHEVGEEYQDLVSLFIQLYVEPETAKEGTPGTTYEVQMDLLNLDGLIEMVPAKAENLQELKKSLYANPNLGYQLSPNPEDRLSLLEVRALKFKVTVSPENQLRLGKFVKVLLSEEGLNRLKAHGFIVGGKDD